MPAQRKKELFGRTSRTDKAGNISATYEPIEAFCRRAQQAGLHPMVIEDWYRQAVERLAEIEAKPKVLDDDIAEMRSIEEAMAFGLAENGVPETFKTKPLIPRKAHFYDLRLRTIRNRERVS